MNNAIYISLARQTGLFRNMDVVANNVANASTPGFKGETMVFEQYLVNDKDQFRKPKIAFSHDVATFTNYKDGEAMPTGRDLDVAIEGEGFFKIETPQGIRYTRRGNFVLDRNNQIVTAEGHAVLSDDGNPIQLKDEDTDITISSDGTVLVSQTGEVGAEKQPRGRIGTVTFKNPQSLEHVDNGMWRAKEPEIADAPAHVIQGSLEQSNVSAISELTHMISINRSISGVTGFMSDMHELTRRAITAYTRAS